jgi:hypothetical protein
MTALAATAAYEKPTAAVREAPGGRLAASTEERRNFR